MPAGSSSGPSHGVVTNHASVFIHADQVARIDFGKEEYAAARSILMDDPDLMVALAESLLSAALGIKRTRAGIAAFEARQRARSATE